MTRRGVCGHKEAKEEAVNIAVFLTASNEITAIDTKSSTYNLKCLIRLLHTQRSVSLPLACCLTRNYLAGDCETLRNE